MEFSDDKEEVTSDEEEAPNPDWNGNNKANKIGHARLFVIGS